MVQLKNVLELANRILRCYPLRFVFPNNRASSCFLFSLTSHSVQAMKPFLTLVAVICSFFLTSNSQAQSSWGTQDTSINWVGFNWRDLGVGGFDTNSDGFGTVGSGLNLGAIDPDLAGLTVDVEVSRSDSSTNSRWIASNGTTLSSALSGGILLEFTFSGPVAFRRTPISAVAFGIGEIETYKSSSLDYMEQGGNFNLVDGVSIDAIAAGTSGSFDLSVEDYNTTFFSVNWDDDVGSALTQALHFEIGVAVPEPVSGMVLSPLVCGIFLRRRRKQQLN